MSSVVYVVQYTLMLREHGATTGTVRVRKAEGAHLEVGDLEAAVPASGRVFWRGKWAQRDGSYVWLDLCGKDARVPLVEGRHAEVKVTPLFALPAGPKSAHRAPEWEVDAALWPHVRSALPHSAVGKRELAECRVVLGRSGKGAGEGNTSGEGSVVEQVGGVLGRAVGSLWSGAAALLEGGLPSDAQLRVLQQTARDASVAFEEGLEEHEEVLERVWRARFPGIAFSRRDARWVDCGFSDANPAEDLGGEGSFFGLQALAFVLETHPVAARRMLAAHARRDPEHRLLLAPTLLALAPRLVPLLCPTGDEANWATRRSKLWPLLDDPSAPFELAYAALVVLERLFVAANASQRDLNAVRSETIEHARLWLQQAPASVHRLHLLVEEAEKVGL